MIFKNWHLPAGIFVSVAAHLGLFTLLIGGAGLSTGQPELEAVKVPQAPAAILESEEMETYPIFKDLSEEEVSEATAPSEAVEKKQPRYPRSRKDSLVDAAESFSGIGQ